MKFRITVRGEHVELRGYVTGSDEECDEHLARLNQFAEEVGAMVIYSPAPQEFNPFMDDL